MLAIVCMCIICLFVLFLFFNSVFLLVCCLCFVFLFFQDISPSIYMLRAVGFSDISMILVNLWKTLTIRDYGSRDGSHLVRHFSLEQSRYFSLSLSLSGFHLV